jgi:two-component system KDP operon response regulator KdpE
VTSGLRVLIVDVDVVSRRELHRSLYTDGFDVTDVEHLEDAVALSLIMQFDAVLLRTDPCHIHESRACRLIRSELACTAIVVLSDSDDSDRKVEALEAGADDYLVGPVRNEELVARIRAILRRSGAGRITHEVVEIGEIRLDAGRRLVFKSGEPVHLTPKEYDLLHYLMLRPGLPVKHSALLSAVWGPDHIDQVAYLRTFMRQLRKKLDDDGHPQYLFTDCYIGYHFVEPENAPSVSNGRAVV